jgi:mono/diheme cytochrome c family protein
LDVEALLRTICSLLVVVVLLLLSRLGDVKADAARGQILSEHWCAGCHALNPSQSSTNPKAPRFPDIAVKPSVTEDSLRTFLKTFHSKMPNFPLKPDDIEDIVSYVLSLKPPR